MINDLTIVRNLSAAAAAKLHIEKAGVECCVVNDECGALHKINELIGDFGKLRLVLQVFRRNAVNGDSASSGTSRSGSTKICR